MNQQRFNMRPALRFKHFTRKGYALFRSFGKEVLICTLSVTTLTYAKADSISVREPLAADSIDSRKVKLDEVVVSGSRAPLTAIQSAKIVSVITRDEIHRAEAASVNDVLKLATGVDVRQRGGFGVQTDISLNGGTFDQITILLNGVNLSNPQTGHNAADFPISLLDIERIEILEGAAARVVGNSAFSGAINIITRKNEPSNIRVSAEGGSFGTFNGDAGVTWSNYHLSNSLSGGYARSDGGMDNSDFDKWRMFYNGNFSSKHINLIWQAGTSSQNFGASTFYSPKFNNQYEETDRYIASVNADIMPTGNRNIILSPSLYWHRGLDHYQLTRGQEGAKAGENFHRADIFGIGMNGFVAWKLGKTSLGFDVRREKLLSTAYGEEMSENKWSAIRGSDRFYDHRGNRTNISVFAEHNIVISKLTISVGALANRNTCLDDKFRFYPGIDISFRPDNHWKLHASWNKALRVPTYTDLYINNATQQGDLNLMPERNSTFKIGSQYKCNGVMTSISAFISNGRDMIDWVFETAESTRYKALNIGKIDNIGVSADATINFDMLLTNPFVQRVKLGYAYINQKHKTDKTIYRSLYALEYLRHKFIMQLDHKIYKHLSAGWTLRWQQRLNGYHPYAKLDAKLTWNGEKYNVFVKADNLTSHRYYDIGGVLQPGFWIMAGCGFKINL